MSSDQPHLELEKEKIDIEKEKLKLERGHLYLKRVQIFLLAYGLVISTVMLILQFSKVEPLFQFFLVSIILVLLFAIATQLESDSRKDSLGLDWVHIIYSIYDIMLKISIAASEEYKELLTKMLKVMIKRAIALAKIEGYNELADYLEKEFEEIKFNKSNLGN